MRIVVCEAQVPFVEGGAEYHVRELLRQLRLHGHQAELVSVPFKWYPKEEILTHAAAWRLLDLSREQRRADRPRDRHEVPVLLRPASSQGRVADPPVPRRVRARRDRLQRLPAPGVGRRPSRAPDGAGQRACSASAAGCSRTRTTPPTGSPATMGCTPNRCIILRGWPSASAAGPYGDYVLSVGRIESVKRVDLAVRALAHVDPAVRLVVAGEGTQRANTERLAAELGRRRSRGLPRRRGR